MRIGLGEKLFTYGLIMDTNLNQEENECNSPFRVNKLADGRMRYVISDLNSRELDFVIHLGDFLHPFPAIPDLYEWAVQCFAEQIKKLRHKYAGWGEAYHSVRMSYVYALLYRDGHVCQCKGFLSARLVYL